MGNRAAAGCSQGSIVQRGRVAIVRLSDLSLAHIGDIGRRGRSGFAGRRDQIAVIQFEGGKIAQEHIYWDQATVLAQLGLLGASRLPVAGTESARKVLGPTLPANTLIARARQGR